MAKLALWDELKGEKIGILEDETEANRSSDEGTYIIAAGPVHQAIDGSR